MNTSIPVQAPPGAALLSPFEPAAAHVERGASKNWFVVSDHASSLIPERLQNLGLSEADRLSHIGWDIGARVIGRRLAQRFECTLVECGYSRLVIDCNRYPEDVAAIPSVSGGIAVPGNLGLNDQQRAARIEEIFKPYQQTVATELDRVQEDGGQPVFISVHSCAAEWNGAKRPWHIGVSWAHDARVASPLLDQLGASCEILVGDNEPYSLDLGIDFTTPEHAVRRGLAHVQIEFRQDLVGSESDALYWADVMVEALLECRSESGWGENVAQLLDYLPAPTTWLKT